MTLPAFDPKCSEDPKEQSEYVIIFFILNCYKLQDFVFSFGLVRFREKNNLVMLWVQITTFLRLGDLRCYGYNYKHKVWE